jgi:hypothetical protein
MFEAMSSVLCRFCAHGNPAGAKFCNECGSPLHLKPCPRCEAITESTAGQCHQCGASFETEAVAETAGEHAAADTLHASTPAAQPASNIPIALAERLGGDTAVRKFDARDRSARSLPNDDTRGERSNGAPEQSDRRFAARSVTPPSRSSPPRSPTAGGAPAAERSVDVPAAASRSVGRTRRASYAALLGVACAIGAAAYFAYVAELPFRSPDVNVAAPMKGTDAATPAAAPAPGVAASAAQAPTDENATTDALAGASAASSDKPTEAPAPAAASRAPDNADARQQQRRLPLAAQRADSRDTSAVATPGAAKRASPRDTSAVAAPGAAKRANRRDTSAIATPAERSARARDKDAAATQRLIARDLAGFTPPQNAQDSAETPRTQ